MKIMLKKFLFFLPLVAILALVSCDGSSSYSDGDDDYAWTYDVTLDNSLDTTVIVILDTSTIELASITSERISLEEGTHKVFVKTVKDSLVMDTTTFELSGYDDVLLNVTRAEYVKNWSYYSVSGNDDILDTYSFTVDSSTFEGVRAELVGGPDDLVIYNDWDYGLDIEMPEEVTVYNGVGEFRTKLYRKDIFVISMQLLDLFDSMGVSEDAGVDYLEELLEETEE